MACGGYERAYLDLFLGVLGCRRVGLSSKVFQLFGLALGQLWVNSGNANSHHDVSELRSLTTVWGAAQAYPNDGRREPRELSYMNTKALVTDA